MQRSGPQEREPDLETAIEDEMVASGRTSVVPREGLVGAHLERRASAGAGLEEPVGSGADVAPTRKAEAREQERHRLARDAAAATREDLDRAASEADRLATARRLTAEGTPARWIERARRWLSGHRQYAALAALSLVVLGVGTYFALRDRT